MYPHSYSIIFYFLRLRLFLRNHFTEKSNMDAASASFGVKCPFIHHSLLQSAAHTFSQRGLKGQPTTCYRFQQGSHGFCHAFENNLLDFYLVKISMQLFFFEKRSFQIGSFYPSVVSLQGRSFREEPEEVNFTILHFLIFYNFLLKFLP